MGAVLVKRVLMVAYHFPPLNVSSGIQRTLRFAQYLPQHKWEPIVLTVNARAYPQLSNASLTELPQGLRVHRVFALDAAKHLSLRGRYPKFVRVPDRWWSWWLGAIPTGLSLIRKLRPDVLWSTYPIATAHVIGHTLHRLTGIPWVADFRDPMAQSDYPPDPLEHRAYEWIEYRTLRHCQRAVFTAPSALRLYADRYRDIPPARLSVIENGFDEPAFAAAEQSTRRREDRVPLVLVHSGAVYPLARDPRCFFGALSELLQRGVINARTFKVVLRATGCDDYLRGVIGRHGLEEIIKLEPTLPYREALAEMLSADGLLLLQAANCNYQVPAKLYEYLRARRPILALTDPAGDTATLLRAAGIDTIAPLDSQEEILQLLTRFLIRIREGSAPVAPEKDVAAASREARTAQFANLLDSISGR